MLLGVVFGCVVADYPGITAVTMAHIPPGQVTPDYATHRVTQAHNRRGVMLGK